MSDAREVLELWRTERDDDQDGLVLDDLAADDLIDRIFAADLVVVWG